MRIAIFGLVLALFCSCGSGKKSDEQAFLEGLDSAKTEGPSISEGVIGDILQQIPSPLEISVLLKESGRKYNAGYLNSADNISNTIATTRKR
jgi:hypothetical protein